MSKRYFTVTEANELVPLLEQVFGRVLRLRGQLRIVAQELERQGEPLGEANLLLTTGAPALVSARGRARALLETLAEEVRGLEALGIEVKDLDTGLCDFVAQRQDAEGTRDVYLCWKLGEKRVDFWHELTAGFAGRASLEPESGPGAESGRSGRVVH